MAQKIMLGNGAFTGSREQGNPYKGDLGKGVAYDLYEARARIVRQDGGHARITTPYREGARQLVKYLRAKKDQTVLDVGSGTGITTIEVLKQNAILNLRVLGVEISPGMLGVGRYKFHMARLGLAQFGDKPELLEYWAQFRAESLQFKRRVEFVLGDIQETSMGNGSADCAVANQVMHWTDLARTFGQLHRILGGEGQVVWNSASHFYDDRGFPSAEYGFRYNDFMGHVMDAVGKRVPVNDYRSLSRPTHAIESIGEITRGQGFRTTQVGTFLVPVDLQTFIGNHVPVFVKQLIAREVSEGELKELTEEAMAAAVRKPKALADMKHKYDIVPIFESVKI